MLMPTVQLVSTLPQVQPDLPRLIGTTPTSIPLTLAFDLFMTTVHRVAETRRKRDERPARKAERKKVRECLRRPLEGMLK